MRSRGPATTSPEPSPSPQGSSSSSTASRSPRSHGWGAPLTLGLLAGAGALLAAFVAIELRSPHPLLPLRVVLDRNRGGAFLASLLVGCALLGTFLFLTYFLQGTLDYSALKTGFAFLPFSGGIILGAGLASRFLPRFGPRPLMTAGLVLAAGGLLLVHPPRRRQLVRRPASFPRSSSSASAWASPSSR